MSGEPADSELVSSDSYHAPCSEETGRQAMAIAAAPAQLSAALTSLVDGFQRKIDDAKAAAELNHATLLEKIKTIEAKQANFQTAVEALPPWRQSLNTKIAQVLGKVEAAAETHDGLSEAVNELKAEEHQLKGAIDTILAQHKCVHSASALEQSLTVHSALSAKVHSLSQAPVPAKPAPSVARATHGDVQLIKPSRAANPAGLIVPPVPSISNNESQTRSYGFEGHRLKEKAFMPINSSAQTGRRAPFSETRSKGIDSTAETSNKPSVSHRPDDKSQLIRNNLFMHGALDGVQMPPPPSFFQREQSVASTVTLCCDGQAPRTRKPARPPMPIRSFVRAGKPVPAAALCPEKEGHETPNARNAFHGDDSEPAFIGVNAGTKRKAVAHTAETVPMRYEQNDIRGSAEAAKADSAKRQKLATTTTEEEAAVEASACHKGSEHVAHRHRREASFDSDEIVVIARRRPKAENNQPVKADDDDKSAEQQSPDPATPAMDLMDSVDIESYGTQHTGHSRSPVQYQEQVTSRAQAEEARVDDGTVALNGDSSPASVAPKAPNPKDVLADLHKRFGVRSDGKENVAPVQGETAKDAIAFGNKRSSRSKPSRKASD